MLKNLLNLIGTPVASSLQRKDQFLALLASFIAMVCIGLLSGWLTPQLQTLLLVASLGPSIVLIFVVPNSPFSQPYPLLMSHFLAAIIGVSCAYLPLDLFLTGAIGLTLCMLAMFAFGCVHPPAGATTMMPIIVGPTAVGGFNFVVFPVLINMGILIILALVFHKWWLKKEYPVHATPTSDPIHQHGDASPLVRLGLHPDDLEAALKDFDAYLNITEKDLTQVYGLAQQKAYTRKFGEIRCKHIMSHDVITVSETTTLEDAWGLLRKHKVKILPVVDQDRRVLGIVSLVDYLKRADLKGYDRLFQRLEDFVTGEGAEDAPTVIDIMASPVFTVNHSDLIASLVPLLSDKGMHHVPVVDDEQRLAGIITQSDLIASLYSSSIQQKDTAVA
ncbi:MAG: CBS domain-containing protein [Pseudomonadales bacterium]